MELSDYPVACNKPNCPVCSIKVETLNELMEDE